MIVSKLINKIYILLTLIIFLILISITVNSQNENQSSQDNCEYGTYQCNGQYIQKCDGQVWFDAEYCKTGCTNGKCNEGSYEPIPETPQEPKPYSQPTPEPQQPSSELVACKHQCEVDAKICFSNSTNVNNNCTNTMYQCQENCEQILPPQNELIDYGDAPDPTFPSLKASNGARHINSEYEWLGLEVTKEINSLQIDADNKDDGITISSLWDLQPCSQEEIPVIISVQNRNDLTHVYENKKLYLNMLFDWNTNGKWGGMGDCGNWLVPEHAVLNFPVDISNWPQGVNTKIVNVNLSTGPLTQNIWVRATLTYDQKIDFPWNGTGKFSFGETEDYGPQGLHEPQNRSRPIIYEEESPSETDLLVDDNYNNECRNNYECESNTCINGTCVVYEQQVEQHPGITFDTIFQSIKDFFSNLF